MTTALIPVAIGLMVIGALLMIVAYFRSGLLRRSFDGGCAIFAAGLCFWLVVAVTAYLNQAGFHGS